MNLRPIGLICTRWHVEQLAAFCEETVTDIDFSKADVVGASTWHQVILSFPDARITGLKGWNKEQYLWVLDSINSDEFKKNQGDIS